jgi:hypothetical protein
VHFNVALLTHKFNLNLAPEDRKLKAPHFQNFDKKYFWKSFHTNEECIQISPKLEEVRKKKKFYETTAA